MLISLFLKLSAKLCENSFIWIFLDSSRIFLIVVAYIL